MRPPKPLQDTETRWEKNSSQADSAGSIPVTRSTREKRCSGIELEDSSPPPICVSVPCSGHYGPQISTPRDSPSSFRRRSACSVMLSGCPVLRFFQRRQGESPQIRGRVNGLNYRSHARAGALDVRHRGARPVNHPSAVRITRRQVNHAAARPGVPGPGQGQPGSDAPAHRRGR